MVVLVLGKKGSGKSALLRKLVWGAVQTRCAIFLHDPQAGVRDSCGKVYESIEAWRADPTPPFLSIFRGVEIEQLAALALEVGDVTLCLDEMDQAFTDKRYARPDSSIRKIIHEGRHYRVSLAGTFRRTSSVPEDLVSQCDYVFLFRQSGTTPTDIQTIKTRFGDAYAGAVQCLSMGQLVVWTDAAA